MGREDRSPFAQPMTGGAFCVLQRSEEVLSGQICEDAVLLWGYNAQVQIADQHHRIILPYPYRVVKGRGRSLSFLIFSEEQVFLEGKLLYPMDGLDTSLAVVPPGRVG